jgi:hypothetical protein
MNTRKISIIFVHAFVGWAMCTATMLIGMETMSIDNALIVHAIGAPIIFTLVSLVYFKKFNYTSPLNTALIFVSFVIVVDFFLIALVINRSLEMFASPLGTWIPFALIFASTYVTGMLITRSPQQQDVSLVEHGSK